MPRKKEDFEESIARAKSRGFTREYQAELEAKDNVIELQEFAPPTNNKYEHLQSIWNM